MQALTSNRGEYLPKPVIIPPSSTLTGLGPRSNQVIVMRPWIKELYIALLTVEWRSCKRLPQRCSTRGGYNRPPQLLPHASADKRGEVGLNGGTAIDARQPRA
ncbi:Uncharacterized protein HZ326_23878 [Fusarium oxysporum f. sp. albedinis]|nr:Uncharacterized protein HZ326_23878 [Fusarium oxysporum f. sp. albedinis]